MTTEKYIHTTYPTGFAIVERAGGDLALVDGELVDVLAGTGTHQRITHGDPEYDRIHGVMSAAMKRSFVEAGEI